MNIFKSTRVSFIAFLCVGLGTIFFFQNCGGRLEAFKQNDGSNADDFSVAIKDFSPSETENETHMQSDGMTGDSITTIDAIKNKVYSLVGQSSLLSVNFVPVNPSKTYRLSASLRSIGNGYSRISFGFISYDENQLPIDAAMVNKNEDPLTVIPENTTSDRIEFSGNPANWADPVYAIGYTRHIGIYFDGNTNRLPDYIIGHLDVIDSGFGRSRGAYSHLNTNNIELNIQIPENILNQMNASTKILNHKSGATHNYAGALAQDVVSEDNWKTFENQITGENYSEIVYNTFWPSTRYVKIYLLVEPENDNVNKQTLVDDIIFEAI